MFHDASVADDDEEVEIFLFMKIVVKPSLKLLGFIVLSRDESEVCVCVCVLFCFCD